MKFLLHSFSVLILSLIPSAWSQEEDSNPEDTPVIHEDIAGDASLTGARSWRPPNYQGQEASLGYAAEAFVPPKELETHYKFWLDVYTKYTTDQGVLHDSENIDLVYEALDFTHISSRTDLDAYQKQRLRKKLVKEAKKRVQARLNKIAKSKSVEELDHEEQKIWKYFDQQKERPKSFSLLGKSNRLRFQLGQRDRIIQGIFFSGRYLEDFEKIFKDAGLPIELTRLVFVESSFNVLARSKVGASGLWQIMRYTARPYMMVNKVVDKRNHPIEATKLAAKLLRNNYELLQSWPLAVTGYNHGPHGVLRLTRSHKTRELADLVLNKADKRSLGFASRNFYMSFLAVLEAERRAPFYFGSVPWSQPLAAKDIRLAKPISFQQLLDWFDGNGERAAIFNPHIMLSAKRGGKVLLPKGAVISVPQAKAELVMVDLGMKSKTDQTPPRAPSPTQQPPAEADKATDKRAVLPADDRMAVNPDFH